MEREKTVCFTGHRQIPDKRRAEILARLYSTVARLIIEGYDCFICGGALGFDTMAAECVLEMKTRSPNVKLILALPCRDQTIRWTSLSDVSKYKDILGKADRVEYIQNFYTDGCMQERNRWMVDRSSVCVAYLTSSKGGTKYTFNYAMKQGARTVNLADGEKCVEQMKLE